MLPWRHGSARVPSTFFNLHIPRKTVFDQKSAFIIFYLVCFNTPSFTKTKIGGGGWGFIFIYYLDCFLFYMKKKMD